MQIKYEYCVALVTDTGKQIILHSLVSENLVGHPQGKKASGQAQVGHKHRVDIFDSVRILQNNILDLIYVHS